MDKRRALLLRARTVDRFDFRIPWSQRRAAPEEAAEEQRASFVVAHPDDYLPLIADGVVSMEGGMIRLTDKGRAELASPEQPRRCDS